MKHKEAPNRTEGKQNEAGFEPTSVDKPVFLMHCEETVGGGGKCTSTFLFSFPRAKCPVQKNINYQTEIKPQLEAKRGS